MEEFRQLLQEKEAVAGDVTLRTWSFSHGAGNQKGYVLCWGN